MRKTNPIFAGVAAVALAATMVPAFALAAESKASDTTTVTYAVTEGYTWSIPSAIDFGQDKGVKQTVDQTKDADGDIAKVAVTKNIIKDGQKLQITAGSAGTQFQIANGTTKLDYAVTAGDNSVNPGDVILEVKAGTNQDEKSLKFTLTTGQGTSEVAGNYTGTLTYTAKVVAQN